MTRPKQSEASMRERKREQNRLSQKCLRERRLLQTRQAASVKEAITTATNGSEDDKAMQIANLSSQLLEATMQIKRLSEALLRMRKKFLSIGTASNLAGEDEIFNDLLGKSSGKRHTSEEQEVEQLETLVKGSSSAGSTPMDESDPTKPTTAHTETPQQFFSGANIHGQRQESAGGSRILDTSLHTTNAFNSHEVLDQEAGVLNGIDGFFDNSASIHQNNDVWFPSDNLELHKAFDQVQNGFHMFQHNSQMPFGLDAFLTRWNPSSDLPLVLSIFSHYRFQGCCLFTNSVEDTCISYAVQLSGSKSLEGASNHSPSNFKSSQVLAAVATRQISEKIVDELVKVAIYLIATFAKMEVFLFCLGADKILEAVLRWRFLPSKKNAYAIPAPFCPTPLQSFGPSHHAMVDCCVWPSLRDQLILHSGKYDIDELSADMMELTVLEIPYLKASANVLDLLVTDVLPQEQSSSMVAEQLSEHLETHEAPPPANLPQSVRQDHSVDSNGPVDRSLLNEIYRRVTSGMIPEIDTVKFPRKSVLAPHFGLNNFHNWRLSTDFGKKYPFLDCTSAESQYPTISAATVQTVGLWVLSA